VPLGALGRVSLWNRSGATHLTVDVVGFYAGNLGRNGTRFKAIDPGRAFFTQTGQGGVPKAPIGPGRTLAFDVRGKAGLPKTGITSVVLNVSVESPTTDGAVTVYAGGTIRPNVASVPFQARLHAANLVVVRVPANGIVNFFNAAGSAQLAVDVVGYYSTAATPDEGRFIPVRASRLWDTRALGGPQIARQREVYPIAGFAGVAHDAGAVMVNATAITPSAPGSLRLFADDLCAVPAVGGPTFVAGRSVTATAITRLSSNRPCVDFAGDIDVYSSVNVHVVIDVTGYFTH
jgi:hypothetical protein